MAIKFACPNSACGRPLSVPDECAGKTGCCPACRVLFTVAPAARMANSNQKPSPPVARSNTVREPDIIEEFELIDEVEDVRPAAISQERSRTPPVGLDKADDRLPRRRPLRDRRRRAEEESGGSELNDLRDYRSGRCDWDKVGLGLTLNYYAVCSVLGVVGIVLGAFLLLVAILKTFGPGPGELPSSGLVTVMHIFVWTVRIVSWLGMLAAAVMGCIGLALGCWAPSRHNAKAFGIITLSLTGVALLVVPFTFLFPALLDLALLGGSNAVAVAASFTFLFYLRALCLNLKARDEAAAVGHLLIGQAVYVAFYVFVLVLAIIAVNGDNLRAVLGNLGELGLTVIIFSFVLFVAGLVFLAWFMNTLVNTIKLIERRKLGGESGWGEMPLWVTFFSVDVALWVILLIVSMILGASRVNNPGVLLPAFEQSRRNSSFPAINPNPLPPPVQNPLPQNPFQQNPQPFGGAPNNNPFPQNPNPAQPNPPPFNPPRNMPGPFRPPMINPGPFRLPPIVRPPFRR